jgi:hypothetical protein
VSPVAPVVRLGRPLPIGTEAEVRVAVVRLGQLRQDAQLRAQLRVRPSDLDVAQGQILNRAQELGMAIPAFALAGEIEAGTGGMTETP